MNTEKENIEAADKRIDELSMKLARTVINSDLCQTASNIALKNIRRQNIESKRAIR